MRKDTRKDSAEFVLRAVGFQGGFFINNLTGIPALCSAVAVVLHYFLLASFMWMNVLTANMVYG